MESLDARTIVRYIRIAESLQQESSEIRQAFYQYSKANPLLYSWFDYEMKTIPLKWDIINAHPQYKEFIDWWFERIPAITICDIPYTRLLPGTVKLQDTETQSEKNLFDSLIPFFLRNRKAF